MDARFEARKDAVHKASTLVAQNHGTVVLEALEVRNMVRSAAGTAQTPGRNVRAKAGLNRSILDQGWGMFRTMLAWKLRERGGRLVEVLAHNTSRTCAACAVPAAWPKWKRRQLPRHSTPASASATPAGRPTAG